VVLLRAVERGREAVIFAGAQTSKGGPRERNLPLFESYFKILPGPRVLLKSPKYCYFIEKSTKYVPSNGIIRTTLNFQFYFELKEFRKN
jgi:hypothetical protein